MHELKYRKGEAEISPDKWYYEIYKNDLPYIISLKELDTEPIGDRVVQVVYEDHPKQYIMGTCYEKLIGTDPDDDEPHPGHCQDLGE